MELVGKEIIHKAYGRGVIIGNNANGITVEFSSKTTQFGFTKNSKSFYTFVDPNIEDYVNNMERVAIEKANKQKHITGFSDFIETYNTALRNEISFLQEEGGKKYDLLNGVKIDSGDMRDVYSFETDTEINFPDNTEVKLWVNDISIDGIIISCEDFSLIVQAESDLGRSLNHIKMSAEPWQLLVGLTERLEELLISPTNIVLDIVNNGRNEIDNNTPISLGQSEAQNKSISDPISFIWGPPGTGKTEVLAHIVLSHMKKGNRVLMLSYSNVSVDGAVLRVHKLNSFLKVGAAVRCGYPKDSWLRESHLSSFNLAIQRHPDLLLERKALLSEKSTLSNKSTRYLQIIERLRDIKKFLKDEENNIVNNALFVATTVSKATVDKAIYEQVFDVVIFDEASMAYVPQIIYSASLATKHFCCIGDFNQLPPIVQTNNASARNILSKDIFHYLRIPALLERGYSHKWLTMLNEQRRMHPDIAKFASINMYHNHLKTVSSIVEDRVLLAKPNPIPNQALGIIDISGMASVCTKTGDKSCINILSAMLSVSAALIASKNGSVGIITPYNAQSRLIRSMLRDIEANHKLKNKIICATVHQFQGSECDIILYDTVDCFILNRLGGLLSSFENNTANRLFNVAVTRARGKFILLSNLQFMNAKINTPKLSTLLLSKAIDNFYSKDKVLNGNQLINTLQQYSIDGFEFLDYSTSFNKFIEDISEAKREVRIELPEPLLNDDNVVEQLLRAIKTTEFKGVNIYIRAKDKSFIPDALSRYAFEKSYLFNPITVIDRQIVWYGQPYSNASYIIDSKTYPVQYKPIIRIAGRYIVNSLIGFLGLTNVLTDDLESEGDSDNFQSYIRSNLKCEKCDSPMKLSKGKKGGFFFGCSNYPKCSSFVSIEKDFVNDYIFKHKQGLKCSVCGYSLEAHQSRYGTWVQCEALKPHKPGFDQI